MQRYVHDPTGSISKHSQGRNRAGSSSCFLERWMHSTFRFPTLETRQREIGAIIIVQRKIAIFICWPWGWDTLAFPFPFLWPRPPFFDCSRRVGAAYGPADGPRVYGRALPVLCSTVSPFQRQSTSTSTSILRNTCNVRPAYLLVRGPHFSFDDMYHLIDLFALFLGLFFSILAIILMMRWHCLLRTYVRKILIFILLFYV